MRLRLRAERVEVGAQVAAHSIHVNQPHHLSLLQRQLLARSGPHRRNLIRSPRQRLVGHAEGLEDLLVEEVGTEELSLDGGEKRPRLGALDDAVVVGAGDRHHLRQPQLRHRLRSHAGTLSGKPMEPMPMMVPCPAIRRGTDNTVPIMPGLVMVTEVS